MWWTALDKISYRNKLVATGALRNTPAAALVILNLQPIHLVGRRDCKEIFDPLMGDRTTCVYGSIIRGIDCTSFRD